MFDFFPPIWNGTLREHYLILFGAAGSIALVAGIVGAWVGARFGLRRIVREVTDALPSAQHQELTAMQLSQLSRAVDAMSIEVERLSEGQRYAAKLLTERRATSFGEAAVERQPGVITPH